MNKQCFKILVLILVTGWFTSCDTVKRVAKNEHLLTKNTVTVNDKKDNTETINNLIHQKPNSKLPILGNLRLNIYNLARPNRDSLFEVWLDKNPKRRERLKKTYSQKQVNKLKESVLNFNDWLKKTGEAPVIVDEERTEKSAKRLESYFKWNGWSNVDVNYNINKLENKRATIDYVVKHGKPYIIDSIVNKIESPAIESIYDRIELNSLLQQNDQYNIPNLVQERDRITNELRNSGFFHFSQDYVKFAVDTVDTNKKANIDIIVQNRAIRTPDSIRRQPFKTYNIKTVNIITDDAFSDRTKPFKDSISYEGYNLYAFDKIKYRPKALTDVLFINPNTIFKDIDRTQTYRHISELRTFKYPDIKYIENPDATLTANIYLAPLKKFSLGFSAEVSQSNIQTVGFALNPSLLIRNIFRGAETLEISAITSIGSSKDQNDDDPFFDINEIGIDFKLTFPRLFSPFNTERIIPKYMSPTTKINLSATGQTNIGLDKQTFSGAFNYTWNPNSTVTNRLNLFEAQYVRNLNIGNYFDVYRNSFNTLNGISQSIDYNNGEDLEFPLQTNAFISDVLNNNTSLNATDDDFKTVNSIDERKQRLTENNLILSTSYSFTKDKRTNLFDEDFSIFRFKLELAGNLLANTSKLLGLNKNDDGRFEIFNVPFSQYVKTEFDYIKHWDLGQKNVLAIRSFAGIAIPYGNSNNIPFAKSFFAGGPNDNRAWSAYRLGPGSSETINEFNEANLKLALSVEHRFNIFENLNGAFFVDAGNIWNVLDDVEDTKATFTGFNSLKDIAIGSGFGLRYDFSFFVFRFDMGFKTYDPFYQDQNRWFNDYNFANAVYNIGINYPF